MTTLVSGKISGFKEKGFKKTIAELTAQVQEIYLADEIPWVVGYSGGKDSTATLQLIWNSIATLPPAQRTKTIHVISTDTLVENPIISGWVAASLEIMAEAARNQDLPFAPHRLFPELKDRFWVNMIGRGYPAPRPKFRWCTERLKINPSNNFILRVVQEHGEVILALGTRKAESQVRAASIEQYSIGAREHLQRHGQLDRSWVYAPIAAWSNDDVWQYLMQVNNPWGIANKDLLGMYQGATEDGECPLVVDTSSPSCGDSRFGCYVCTMVTEDKSMRSMIANDSEKEWMLPLLQFRNRYLGDLNDRHVRDFRRMNGTLFIHHDRLVHGPYTQSYRSDLLRALLEAQIIVNQKLPKGIPQLELITMDELQEIRRIWLVDKREIEDFLPQIFVAVTGKAFPTSASGSEPVLRADEIDILQRVSHAEGVDKTLHYQLVRNLITAQTLADAGHSRARVLEELDQVLEKNAFADAGEALQIALGRRKAGMIEEASDSLDPEIGPLLVQISSVEHHDIP